MKLVISSLLAGICLIAIVAYFRTNDSPPPAVADAQFSVESKPENVASAHSPAVESRSESAAPTVTDRGELENEKAGKPRTEKTRLTAGNFRSFVQRCFQGEVCELDEDPTKFYRELVANNQRQDADLLISYLRSRLRDPEDRVRYKDPLREMIRDFYPPEEKQFQEAAYYNYLGELEKSLELYLDLERKSALDSSLRPAPKLNIANTFYDLGRSKEALPYYEAALEGYLSGQNRVLAPSQNDMIRFIEDRVEEIRKRSSP